MSINVCRTRRLTKTALSSVGTLAVAVAVTHSLAFTARAAHADVFAQRNSCKPLIRATKKPIIGPITRPDYTRPAYKKPVEKKPIGQRFLVTGKWEVTNADDGTSFTGKPDKEVEVQGSTQFDGKTVHSRTNLAPSIIRTAGNVFSTTPLVVDFYYDRPGSKMLRVSGEYVDYDSGSGNDLMWRHDAQIDLNQVLQDGRGAQGSVRSGEIVLPGDNNSESLDVTIKVAGGELLY